MEAMSGKTPVEVRRALRLCQYPNISCGHCPYSGAILCQDKLRADAARLITALDKALARRDALLAVLGVSVPGDDLRKDTKVE